MPGRLAPMRREHVGRRSWAGQTGCGAKVLGAPGVPLGGVGDDRPAALGHLVEEDLGDRQHVRSPMKPTLNSRPADVLLDQHLVPVLAAWWPAGSGAPGAWCRPRPASIPTLASSRVRLDDDRQREVGGDLLACASMKAGTGRPPAASRVLATCFRWQTATGQRRQPVNGTPVSSSAATTKSS